MENIVDANCGGKVKVICNRTNAFGDGKRTIIFGLKFRTGSFGKGIRGSDHAKEDLVSNVEGDMITKAVGIFGLSVLGFPKEVFDKGKCCEDIVGGGLDGWDRR